MSEESKLCPFCKSDKAPDCEMRASQTMQSVCSLCRAKGPLVPISSGEDEALQVALSLWNTRPTEDALQARIAELEAELAQIRKDFALPDDDDPLATAELVKCGTFTDEAQKPREFINISKDLYDSLQADRRRLETLAEHVHLGHVGDTWHLSLTVTREGECPADLREAADRLLERP